MTGTATAAMRAALLAGFVTAGLFGGGGVLAQAAPETATLGESVITLYPADFLDPVEVGTLRAVMTNEQALALFVGEKGGHSAMAVAPADGFIRDGKPTASALALGGYADAETARAAALKGCNEKKSGGADCVIVLSVSPAG